MQTISKELRTSQDVFGAGSKNSRPRVAQIRDLRGVTMPAKCALYALNSREPNIFPSMQTLAADMGTSIWTARRAVRELERVGYLRVKFRSNQTSLYSITLSGATPTLASMPSPPAESASTPPLASMPPPPSTRATPPLAPVLPEVASEVYKERSKRERERTLSPDNHSLKENLTCPSCKRLWPARFGSICHHCKKDIGTILQDEEAKTCSENQRVKREGERDPALQQVDEWKAERAKHSPEEIEAERQSIRQFLFDETGKPYDEAILKHLDLGKDGGKL